MSGSDMPLEELLGHLNDLARSSLSLWDVPDGATARLINVSENATYLVEAPGGYRAVLRIHRENYHTHRAIECELGWLEALDEAGVVITPGVYTGRNGDPDNIAFAAYHSSRNGSWQNPVYRNPEVDALIEAGRSEIDTDKRVAIYGAFQEKVVADAPDIFGVLERRKLGMRDSVQNYSFTPVASNAIEAWPLSLG